MVHQSQRRGLTQARFLFEKGKTEECRRVLGRLHGYTQREGEMVLCEQGEIEFDAMKAAITWDREHGQDKWSAMWNSKSARYRSFVACSSQSWWGELRRVIPPSSCG